MPKFTRFIAAAFLRENDGQDLIEYALVVALIALAPLGMGTVASRISSAFTSIGATLSTYVS